MVSRCGDDILFEMGNLVMAFGFGHSKVQGGEGKFISCDACMYGMGKVIQKGGRKILV